MPDDIDLQPLTRRRFVGMAAATIATASLSRLALAETNQENGGIAQIAGGDKTAIRPLRVHAPESQLVDLRRRVKATGGLSGKR